MSDTSFLARQQLYVWKKIGEGSFSKVYLSKYGGIVNDKVTLVATKVINKNRVSLKFVEKFLPRELDVLVKLRHPYIVQNMTDVWNKKIPMGDRILHKNDVVCELNFLFNDIKKKNSNEDEKVYSIYQSDHKVFINMEYAENGDMYAYLRKSTLTEAQIRIWILQILWAFRYMQALGVVHRDLKCENILLTSNYNLRIADFGFARFVDVTRNPSVSTVCGTMAYSPPEVLSATRPYNPMAADVWAIGVVLFMMANNVVPFRNKRKEDVYKKQMVRDYVFRKVLDRSESLKELTALFLEPDTIKRIRVKTALQHPWIKSDGNVITPLFVHNVSEIADAQRTVLKVPIITQATLKTSQFNYQVAEHIKSISTFNEFFTVIDEHEDTLF